MKSRKLIRLFNSRDFGNHFVLRYSVKYILYNTGCSECWPNCQIRGSWYVLWHFPNAIEYIYIYICRLRTKHTGLLINIDYTRAFVKDKDSRSCEPTTFPYQLLLIPINHATISRILFLPPVTDRQKADCTHKHFLISSKPTAWPCDVVVHKGQRNLDIYVLLVYGYYKKDGIHQHIHRTMKSSFHIWVSTQRNSFSLVSY